MTVLKSRESLAVKYRPKRLEHLIGQEEIVSLLQGQLRSKSGMNRSFLLSGPSGCGKCIVAGSMVLTPVGFQNIESLVQVGDKEGFTERGVDVCNQHGEYETTSHTFYEKTQETIKITTASGFEIEGTHEHKLLCFSDDLVPVWKRLDEITDGDYVAVQRDMQLWPESSPDLTSFSMSSFKTERFSCVDCKSTCKATLCAEFDPIDTVTCRVCGGEYGNLSTHTPLHGMEPQQYKALYDAPLISPAQHYKSGTNYDDCYLPTSMTEDLASLLGYIVAEASITEKGIRFYNKDRFVIDHFKDLYLKVFKEELHEIYDAYGVCKFEILGIKRARFFHWLGVLLGHSRVRCIPTAILQSPKNIMAAFLRAYFEGDAGWEIGRISASSASEKMVRQLQVVLLNFGIVSTITTKTVNGIKYWRLNIYSSDIDLFVEQIGFLSPQKQAGYIKKARNTNSDVIPRVGNYLEALKRQYRINKSGMYRIDGREIKINLSSYSNHKSPNWSYPHVASYLAGAEGQTLLQYFPDHYNKLKALYSLNFYWSRVKDIGYKQEEKYVYDVSLPSTHSFFANGFVNHNTTLGRIVAHYLNCEHFDQDTCLPCGTCDYCKDVARGYYGGVEELNFSDTRGIDTVRAVIDSTAYASPYNAHVFICDEIQCLTTVAQNALLKILEEPPEGVVFLLLTTDPHRLLPTIINRCCPLTVSRVDTDVISKYLLKICQLENRDYFTPKKKFETQEETVAAFGKAYAIFKNIAMFSNGLVRQALATLEAVLSMIEGGQHIETDDVEAIRKIVGRFLDNPDTEPSLADFLIQGVYSGRYSTTLSCVQKLMNSSQSSSCKYLFERALDNHIQTLYFLVDPNRKFGNLSDAFYTRWYSSLVEQVKKPNGFQLTYQAAADMVGVFMQLLSDMSTFAMDERRLVIAHTLKMLDAVHKHRHLAYTKASAFHKVYAPNLLKE